MTFVDYIIKERSRKFLSISLMDMEKSNYKGTLEEWFSDMYIDYVYILNQNKEDERIGTTSAYERISVIARMKDKTATGLTRDDLLDQNEDE
tara:strand:- start:335 stop:610 length:276 start_codon:yes stop_codon:yes gene_type:complete